MFSNNNQSKVHGFEVNFQNHTIKRKPNDFRFQISSLNAGQAPAAQPKCLPMTVIYWGVNAIGTLFTSTLMKEGLYIP